MGFLKFHNEWDFFKKIIFFYNRNKLQKKQNSNTIFFYKIISRLFQLNQIQRSNKILPSITIKNDNGGFK